MSSVPAAALDLDEALLRVWSALPLPEREPIRADRDDPASDRSAMDGLAVRSADGRRPREVLGTLFAGDPPPERPLGFLEAWRIMTGATLPPGADAVVPVERFRMRGGKAIPETGPERGAHVRRQGDHAQAGALLVPGGRPLNAVRTGLRAQVGMEPLVPLRPRVAVVSSGDELSEAPGPHQVRDANGPMLAALALGLGAGVSRLPALPDELDAMAAALRELRGCEVLLTSGGVSAGDRDLLPRALREAGAEILFHHIHLKPGKPLLAARLGRTLVLALPGNPVAAYLDALLFLPVALARLREQPFPDPWGQGLLLNPVPNPGPRPLLHPCRRSGRQLMPMRYRGSADLPTLAQADVVAWIPPGERPVCDTRYLPLL